MQTKAVTKVNDPGQIHKYSHIILDEARWLSVANAEATEAHTHTQVQGNHILSLDAKPKKTRVLQRNPTLRGLLLITMLLLLFILERLPQRKLVVQTVSCQPHDARMASAAALIDYKSHTLPEAHGLVAQPWRCSPNARASCGCGYSSTLAAQSADGWLGNCISISISIYIYISIIFLCPPKLHGWYIKRKFQPGTFGTERYQKIMMRAGVMHI